MSDGKPSANKKVLVMTIAVLYFVVGFFLLVLLSGSFIGANYAGLAGLAYLAVGWYFLVKKRALLNLARR